MIKRSRQSLLAARPSLRGPRVAAPAGCLGRDEMPPRVLCKSILVVRDGIESPGQPAYGLHALRTDLDRFTFLLGGTDGEDLFGHY